MTGGRSMWALACPTDEEPQNAGVGTRSGANPRNPRLIRANLCQNPQYAAPARWDALLGLPEDDGKLRLVAKRRSKHGLEVGFRVRAGLVVEPAVNDLLLNELAQSPRVAA